MCQTKICCGVDIRVFRSIFVSLGINSQLLRLHDRQRVKTIKLRQFFVAFSMKGVPLGIQYSLWKILPGFLQMETGFWNTFSKIFAFIQIKKYMKLSQCFYGVREDSKLSTSSCSTIFIYSFYNNLKNDLKIWLEIYIDWNFADECRLTAIIHNCCNNALSSGCVLSKNSGFEYISGLSLTPRGSRDFSTSSQSTC